MLSDLGIDAYMRRDDELPVSGAGNKLYKLYYNLLKAIEDQSSAIVAFGGPYSNFIHTLAAAGHELSLPTVGIIRGKYHQDALTDTLEDAKKFGMELLFLDKKAYKNKDLTSLSTILNEKYPNYYVVPEGAANSLGVKGCEEIGRAISAQVSGEYTVCCASATGSTIAGIAMGSPSRAKIMGVCVLKGEGLEQTVQEWLLSAESDKQLPTIVEGYHHGGYAKVNEKLLRFMMDFEVNNQIQLDPVYTAKLVWAVEDLAKKGYWNAGDKVVLLHSGGLQGRRGFSQLQSLRYS